jgi:superfamily I DNA/RNA helicase
LTKGIKRPYAKEERDDFIFRPGYLTISTPHSAKGYDAQIVFLLGTDQYSAEPEGRASFYVGATRAKLLLYVTGRDGTNTLLHEAQKLLRMFGSERRVG